jgi:plastocyanin domain-containing protein
MSIAPRLVPRIIGLFALSLALGACAATWETPKTPLVAEVGADGVQHVTVTGGNYYFDPSRIVVKANVPVELSLRKESGLVPHEFVLSAPDAGIVISESLSTEPKVVVFTPTLPGEYPYYCGKKLLFFPSHKEQGMSGVLEVVP